jgi:hypothetical protein
VKFGKGKQKEFLKKVLENSNCPSLRSLLQYGFDVKYSALKNYYSEIRLLPEELFNNLCYFAKIPPEGLSIIYLDENWGQVKGSKSIKNKN